MCYIREREDTFVCRVTSVRKCPRNPISGCDRCFINSIESVSVNLKVETVEVLLPRPDPKKFRREGVTVSRFIEDSIGVG